jgi:hypothetical protein
VTHHFPWRPLLVGFTVNLFSVGLLLHANPKPPEPSDALPSVQALDPETSPSGPVILDLFGRFPWRHGANTGCGTKTAKCLTGSKGDQGCGPGLSEHTQCLNTGCFSASDCGAPKHNNDCCCECTQTVRPCVNCTAVGRCV